MDVNGDGLIYLACPYSHQDPVVRAARFEVANLAAGRLMDEGHLVFSPISHTHPVALAYGLPTGFDYWERYDRAMLSRCSRLVVLTLDGWVESVGVNAEIRISQEFGLPVFLMDWPQEGQTIKVRPW